MKKHHKGHRKQHDKRHDKQHDERPEKAPKVCSSAGKEFVPGDQLARIEPLGAVGGVTGSCTLITTARSRILVDAGMFQGGRWADSANRKPLVVSPARLDAVVLTHAHLDHCGLLPRFFTSDKKSGRLNAPIHASTPSAELVPIMLRDSAHIQEVDAEHDNRRAQRRGGRLVTPLYTSVDAERAIERLKPHDFDTEFQVTEDISVRYRRAGHIIGAASVELTITSQGETRRLVFSGDLGRKDAPLVCDPVTPKFDDGPPDLVFCESTYGDREHKDAGDTRAELEAILDETHRSGGTIVIPVFAVGRAQELLLALRQAFADRPDLQRAVILDSPMAITVTGLYRKFTYCFSSQLPQLDAVGGSFEPAGLELTRLPEESMALNDRKGIIILSASGMCDAGRIRHHLKHRLWSPENHIVIVGFQAQGSLGRRLVDGDKRVKMMGEEILVRAKIHTLGGYSAHAAQSSLHEWIDSVRGPATQLVLNHGEDQARATLAQLIQPELPEPPMVPNPCDWMSLPRGADRRAKLHPAVE